MSKRNIVKIYGQYYYTFTISSVIHISHFNVYWQSHHHILVCTVSRSDHFDGYVPWYSPILHKFHIAGINDSNRYWIIANGYRFLASSSDH